MKLQTLISGLGKPRVSRSTRVEISHFSADSREIGPGGLFVATRGFGSDGHDFIDAAIAQGAAAVIAETPAPADAGATWVQVDDSTDALAVVADAFYEHPSQTVAVLATTGTNGKTTVSWLLYEILTHAKKKPGLLSTVEVRIGAEVRPTIFTTPPAPAFQAMLAEMRAQGCTHAVVEASSHGLHQRRMASFRVAVGGFTNLSRDHLDYHGTMKAYEAAKRLLFERLADKACFNVDDPAGLRFADRFEGEQLCVSARGDEDADVVATEPRFSLDGTLAQVETDEGVFPLKLRLIGAHNLENAMVALGMARLAGIPYHVAMRALAAAQGAPGRLQRVPGPDGALSRVFVDYAHTPDALTNVLTALRPLVPGRLICVFGAGGDRDQGKRPLMAAAVAAVADVAIVTSDNPRTEDPAAIVAGIVAGFPADASFVVELDRRRAIERAVADAGPDDCLLIAGKGHEDYQIIGDVRHAFDDVRVAADALENAAGGRS